MEIRKGKSQEELMEVLKALNESLNIDSIAKPGNPVVVTGYRRHGKIRNWAVSLPGAKNCAQKGDTYDSFLDAVDQMENHEDINDFSILCLCQTELNRDWDGKQKSTWFLVDPYEPYRIQEGQPSFQIKELKLSDEEHTLMTDTGVAFFNEITGVIYPITKAAIPYLGGYLSVIMERNYDKLGVALMLSSELEDNNTIHMITGKKTGNIRPIRALAGRKYVYIAQMNFFQNIFQETGKYFDYEVHKWSVSNSRTIVEMYVNPVYGGWIGSCKYGIRVENSDLPGVSMSVSAFTRFEEETIILKKNTCEHTATFQMEKDIPKLFCGLSEAFTQFSTIWDSLADVRVRYSPDLIMPILSVIGKKRSKGIIIPEQVYPAQKLYQTILSKTNVPLPEKSEVKLQNAYYELLLKMEHMERVEIKTA